MAGVVAIAAVDEALGLLAGVADAGLAQPVFAAAEEADGWGGIGILIDVVLRVHGDG